MRDLARSSIPNEEVIMPHFNHLDSVMVTFVENPHFGEKGRLLSPTWLDPWAAVSKPGTAPEEDAPVVLVLPFVGQVNPTGMMARLTTRHYVWPPPQGNSPNWRAIKTMSNLIFLKGRLNQTYNGTYRVGAGGQEHDHVSCPEYEDHLRDVCRLLPVLKTVLEIELGPRRSNSWFTTHLTPEVAARLQEKYRQGQFRTWLRGLSPQPDEDYFAFKYLQCVAALMDDGQI
jgi:hypothetical protein